MPRRRARKRAQRALRRAQGNRRLLVAATASAGVALAACVARGLVGRDREGDHEDGPSRVYRIKRGEKPAKAVARIAGGRLDDALERLFEGVDRDFATAVHETRKDLKKTRAVLRLVRDQIGEETYRRENTRLRDAGRSLAGSRDAEAKVETIASLTERFGGELPEGLKLRRRLEEERRALLSAESGDEPQARRLADQATGEIAAGRAALADWSYAESGWKLLAPGLKRSYKRGRDRFHDVLREPSPENVHEWRKRVKDLWYHLRLLRDCWPEVLQGMSDQAHELSDLLGDHHDLTVLAQDLEDRPDLAGGRREAAAVVALIEKRQHELREAAVPLGGRLYADRPKAFVDRLGAYWRAWRAD